MRFAELTPDEHRRRRRLLRALVMTGASLGGLGIALGIAAVVVGSAGSATIYMAPLFLVPGVALAVATATVGVFGGLFLRYLTPEEASAGEEPQPVASGGRPSPRGRRR